MYASLAWWGCAVAEYKHRLELTAELKHSHLIKHDMPDAGMFADRVDFQVPGQFGAGQFEKKDEKKEVEKKIAEIEAVLMRRRLLKKKGIDKKNIAEMEAGLMKKYC